MSANMGWSFISYRGQHLTKIECSTAMGINNVQFFIKALLGSLHQDLPALRDPVDLLGHVTLATVSFPPSECSRAVNAGQRTRHPASKGRKGRPGCVWLIDLVYSLSDNIWKQDIYIYILFYFLTPVPLCWVLLSGLFFASKEKKKNFSIFPQYCLSASLCPFFLSPPPPPTVM